MPLIEINHPILWIESHAAVGKLMEALAEAQPMRRHWAKESTGRETTEYCFHPPSHTSLVEMSHPVPEQIYFIPEESWKLMDQERQAAYQQTSHTQETEEASS